MNANEQRLFDVLRGQGFEVHRRGWPDFLVIDRRTRPRGFALELKTAGDRVSADQAAMHAALGELGVPVYVARSADRLAGRSLPSRPVMRSLSATPRTSLGPSTIVTECGVHYTDSTCPNDCHCASAPCNCVKCRSTRVSLRSQLAALDRQRQELEWQMKNFTAQTESFAAILEITAPLFDISLLGIATAEASPDNESATSS